MPEIRRVAAADIPELIKQIIKLADERHPVVTELGLYTFWGAETMVLYGDKFDLPLSVHCSKFGRRRKNIFEPYMNFYSAYTLPLARREGHATALYRAAERIALERGCRRVKSLAGSAAGLALHASLGHLCWGQKDTGEVFVDSPLPGMAPLYEGARAPDLVPMDRPMRPAEINALVKKGLRYDHR